MKMVKSKIGVGENVIKNKSFTLMKPLSQKQKRKIVYY